MSKEIQQISTLSVKSETAKLAEIRAFVGDALEQVEFDMQLRNGIILAVDEACSNLIIHGYHNVESNIIEVRFDVDSENIIITISDTAIAFDPAQADEPDLASYFQHPKRGGLGILLMTRVMDDVKYFRAKADGFKNQLVLRKRRV